MPQTVLLTLTGVTGFIAKRIAVDFLNTGHTVRGSLRSAACADEVRDALRPHLTDASALDRLSFIELDLSSDTGWDAAMQGVEALMHTASPFPMAQPKNEDEIIRPAVDGTLRALSAAQRAGVSRVILTSSCAAIEACEVGGRPYTPDDWSDLGHPRALAYYKSKTMAERAAWDFAVEHPDIKLTSINPGLVLGMPIDKNYGTSLQVVERIVTGKDPALADIGFGIVDLEDVSAMHIRALERPETAGNRYIATAGSASFPQIAAHIRTTYPERKIATRIAPKLLLRFLSLFDASVSVVLHNLGFLPQFDASSTTRDLGITFTPWQTAVDRAAKAIVAKSG